MSSNPGDMPMNAQDATNGLFVDGIAITQRIRDELAVWNSDKTAALASQLDAALVTGDLIQRTLMPGLLTLLARVYVNRAESQVGDVAQQVQRVTVLLEQASKMLEASDAHLAEVTALKASLENLQNGADAGLSLLEGRTDPYAIRARTALLLKQQKFAEAMAVVEGLEPHEWWCDVAVKAYALNDQVERAQVLVRWAAGLSDRSRYPQCVVRLAEGLLARTLAGHDKGVNILPQDITPNERDKLELVAESLRPVLQTVRAAGKPNSGLDMAALQIAWQANHLLQRREAVAELLGLM